MIVAGVSTSTASQIFLERVPGILQVKVLFLTGSIFCSSCLKPSDLLSFLSNASIMWVFNLSYNKQDKSPFKLIHLLLRQELKESERS